MVFSYWKFLLSLTFICLFVGIAFWLLKNGGIEKNESSEVGWYYPFVWAAIVGSLLMGVWVSGNEWARFGYPCWDNYCNFAAHIRNWISDPTSWSALRKHIEANIHANSPIGPVLIALVGFIIPDIPTAYRVISAVATISTIPIIMRIAKNHLRLTQLQTAVIIFLFVSSSHVQRGLLFPQTDPLAMFFFVLALNQLFLLRIKFTVWRFVGYTAISSVALLTKLSTLPILGISVAMILWPLPSASGVSIKQQLISKGFISLVVILTPALVFGLYILGLDTFGNYLKELAAKSTIDSRFIMHLRAATAALLPLFFAVLLTIKHKWSPEEGILLLVIGIYILGLWIGDASGWDRFYLLVLPIALTLTVRRLSILPGSKYPPRVIVLCLAYGLTHWIKMHFGLFY
jgi:hypothetical protein